MPHKDEQLTLLGFICSPFMPSIIKRPSFGGAYVLGVDLLKVETLVYLIGAILGRALQHKLNILTKLLFVRGTQEHKVNEITALYKESAKKNLKEFESWCRGGPIRFDDVLFYRRVEARLGTAGVQMSPRGAYEAYLRGDKKLKKLFHEKVDSKGVGEQIMMYILQGIFFGSSFPELTQTMYQEAWENDRDFLSHIWPHGLVMPEQLKAARLDEAEKAVLQIVALYVSEYYPELIDGLGLMSVIHEVESGRYDYQPQVDPLLHKRVQELSSVEEGHNAELEDFWNSTSPDECASLMVNFLDELRHNWPREYSQLNPERLPDAISKGFKDGITRAYKVGYMRGKGWISQEHLGACVGNSFGQEGGL